MDYPFGLLIRGYCLAAAVAAGAAALGVGALGAALIFWLGGAVAVLALAAVAMARAGDRADQRPARENVALDGELAAWERDRREDAAPAVAPATRAG